LLHEKCQISADVFFYSQEEFDDWKDELSSIPETALNTGIEIKLRLISIEDFLQLRKCPAQLTELW